MAYGFIGGSVGRAVETFLPQIKVREMATKEWSKTFFEVSS